MIGMARRREDDTFILSDYFPYLDAAEAVTVAQEGVFAIPNAPDLGRKRRGRSFESPTLPAPARRVVAPASLAALPPPRPRALPTPSGVAPAAGAGGFGSSQRRPTGSGVGSVGDAYDYAGSPTYAPTLSGGAAGGGAGAASGGYTPSQQIVRNPQGRKGRRR